MTKRLHTVALLTAAGALLAVPAIGQADKRPGGHHNHGKRAKSCTAQPNVNKGFVVKGTLKTYQADTDATNGDQTKVVLNVTGANRHARLSAFTDIDTGTPGFQYGNATYTANASTDRLGFKLRLSGYEGTDAPSLGDKVRVIGKVPVIRKKCVDGNGTLASRYLVDDIDIRRVKIIDDTPDTP